MPKPPSTLLLAALALAHCALFPGESRGTVLDSICPGASDTELIEELGTPLASEQKKDFRVHTYSQPEAGIAGATTWSDSDGTVRWARIQLVNELPPVAAQLLFNLISGETETAGHALASTEQVEGLTRHYAADGVHFFLTDNVVREIWRTFPRADLASIRTASEASWPWDLPTAAPAVDVESSGSNQFVGSPISGQLLSISNLETSVVEKDEEYMFVVKGRVHAMGFQGEEITMWGAMADEDENRMKAHPDAPAEFRTQDGHLQVTTVDTVQYADASWDEVTFLFPFKHILKSEDLFRTYILRIVASCGGKSVFCSKEFQLRPDDPLAGRINREIRLHDTPLVKESVQENMGAGILVQFPVEVIGCTGSEFHVIVFLHDQDGTAISPSPGWDSWRDRSGGFYAKNSTQVLYDHSNWNPYEIFVPYAALDLPAGENPLCMSLFTYCLNVRAVLQFDITVVKP